MKKIAMSVAAATMLLGGLTACGTNDGSDMRANNRQTGYESQNLNGNNQGMNYNSSYRGQGPVTDMMTPDGRNRAGTFGELDRNRTRVNNNNTTRGNRYGTSSNYGMRTKGITGNNQPGMVDGDGLLRGRARDGAMNNRTMDGTRSYNTTRNQGYSMQNRETNYHKDYDSREAQRIASRVAKISGVDDARVIVHKNDIVVGVETNGKTDNIRNEVEQKIKGLSQGKDVHVVTDSDAVDRIRTMDDRLRTGTAFEEIGTTFTDLVSDVGRTIQRPFQRTQ